jgi:hypothetical protein
MTGVLIRKNLDTKKTSGKVPQEVHVRTQQEGSYLQGTLGETNPANLGLGLLASRTVSK